METSGLTLTSLGQWRDREASQVGHTAHLTVEPKPQSLGGSTAL
jgi:hypothetical protein